MSTSLLDHAFGVRGYPYVRTEYQGGQTTFSIRQEGKALRCPACGPRDGRPKGQIERRFRSLPIGGRATIVVLPIPRVACGACRVTRQVEVPFADPRRSYTKAFERYALDLSRRMTIRDVSRHLGVSWDVVKDIQKRDLEVAMDMSPAYRNAVSVNLPKAVIVFDPFHVIKLFNDRLSDLRRWLYHRAGDEQKKVLKGVRWLLLTSQSGRSAINLHRANSSYLR